MHTSSRFLGLFSNTGKQADTGKGGSANAGNSWLASNPSKRWCELFFLGYSPVWITALLCVVVPLRLYEDFDEWGYLALGVGTVTPLLAVPLLFPCEADKGKPLHQQYWFKANVWIAVFGFIGNYFYTHYFFQLLGAAYTMPSHRLNDIPIALYLITHAYFCLYHALSNLLIRRTLAAARAKGVKYPWVAAAVVIFTLAYVTAFMETFTIAHYPHYTHTNKSMMYSVGSLFYAIYFWVSFPAFFLMDEDTSKPRMPLWRAAWDALAAGMLVLIILDFWRLYIGDIAPTSSSQKGPAQGLPWLNGGMN